MRSPSPLQRCATTLGLLLMTAAQAADPLPLANDPAQALAAFEARAGIRTWPRLVGCGYDQSFQGVVVGLVLLVDAPGTARARWDSPCHVPARHRLLDWPAHLPRGRYVVAATLGAAPDETGRPDHRNPLLQVLAVLGDAPNQAPLIDSALRRICATPGDDEQDGVCQRLR